MTTHFPHDRLTSFLLNLECLSISGQIEAFINEVIETDGIYTAPLKGDDTNRHMFEVNLHGIYAFGETETAAITLWKSVARAALDMMVEKDGFITVHPPFPKPRNHGEEIANARATFGVAQ